MINSPVRQVVRPQIHFSQTDLIKPGDAQLRPDQINNIIVCLPQTIVELSQLRGVEYHHVNRIPVPIFEKNGDWLDKYEMVDADRFPRSFDYPGRILIGYCDGETIYPSALPSSISSNDSARFFYQVHVFLHEFFHSIEFLRRSEKIRGRIRLGGAHGPFTFQEWWIRWEEIFLTGHKPPSRYAATYADDLTVYVRNNDYDRFQRALAEQICESFVGYVMGIVPNDQNIPVFMNQAPELWRLIDSLRASRIDSM